MQMIRFFPVFFLMIIVLLPSQVFAQIFPIAIPNDPRFDGSWTPTPLWSKIDEGLVSPDGIIIVSPVNPSDAMFQVELDNPIGEFGIVDIMSLEVRARKTSSSTVTLFCLVFDPDEPLLIHSWIGSLTTTMANYVAFPTSGLMYSREDFANVYIQCTGNKPGGGASVQIEIDVLQLVMQEFPPERFGDTNKIIYIFLLLGFMILGYTYRAGIFFLGAIFLMALLMLEYDTMLFYILGAGLIPFLLFATANSVKGD